MSKTKVHATVKINGGVYNYDKIELKQSLQDHHRFEVQIKQSIKTQALFDIPPKELVEKYLGKAIAIEMLDEETKEKNIFEGIVTEIKYINIENNNIVILFKGGSPTLLFDQDASFESFVDCNLEQITNAVIRNTGFYLDKKIKPQNNIDLPYICRYGESGFAFLQRLCGSLGEWFFYDGEALRIGFNPEEDKKALELTCGEDLFETQLSSALGHFSVYSDEYDPSVHKPQKLRAEGQKLDSHLRVTQEKSKENHKTDYHMRTLLPFDENNKLLSWRALQSEQARNYAEASVFTAKAKTCSIRLGENIHVISKDKKSIDVVRVLEITHFFDRTNDYYNTLKAMSSDIKVLPYLKQTPPTAHPEVATVIDNNDPKNLGRVKVQFVWQKQHFTKSNLTTNWIRVQTPDAGSSETVKSNRGFFFVPEIGDQVMVGFEHGSPEKPFVMGAMFHKQNTEGIAEKNMIKSMITASGHTLEFNDDIENEVGGIIIKDAKGNSIHLKTKNQNLEITAVEGITFNAKNITMNATEKLTQTVGEFEQTVEKNSDITIKGSDTKTVEKDVQLEIGGDENHMVKGNLDLQSKEVIISSEGDMTLAAGGELISSGKTTNVNGKTVEIGKGGGVMRSGSGGSATSSGSTVAASGSAAAVATPSTETAKFMETMFVEEEKEQKKEEEEKKKRYDIDKAVAYLMKNVQGKSISKCAAFVREAIEAGGITLKDRPTSGYAKHYNQTLPKNGFVEVPKEGYIAKKGDIVVMDNHPEGSEAGHIAMFNGEKWAADFVHAEDHWASTKYRNYQPKHAFFRWKE